MFHVAYPGFSPFRLQRLVVLLQQDTSPLDIAKALVIWPILYLPLCHFLVSPVSLTFPLATDKNILLSAKSSLAYLLCLENLFC